MIDAGPTAAPQPLAPQQAIPVTLAEPNVLLLDRVSWRLAETDPWQPREERLRITNAVGKTAAGRPTTAKSPSPGRLPRQATRARPCARQYTVALHSSVTTPPPLCN